MRTDHYARSGRRWALGAELVYRPIAAELVAMSPHSLAGRTVLEELDTTPYDLYAHQNEDIVRLTPEQLKARMAAKEAAKSGGS